MLAETITAVLPTPTPLRLDGAALFLDLDGTLAPLEARPQDVCPDPRRTDLLMRLNDRLQGRLAVVSGRTLVDIDRILEGCVTPAAAVHGLVLRDPHGEVSRRMAHPKLGEATMRLQAFAAAHPGLLVEDKGLSVALHFRQAPELAEPVRQVARELAARTGLTLQGGHMVEELRTPGPGKGESLRSFMDLRPFAGARPVFVGDDATDEAGFEAARALGGIGVAVGPRYFENANYRLADVGAALDWLEAAL